jgi:hypothetical protein
MRLAARMSQGSKALNRWLIDVAIIMRLAAPGKTLQA